MNKVLNTTKEITTFHDLIHPISFEDFKEKYWDNQVMLVRREDANYFQSLINISKVDEVLDFHRPKGGGLRVVKNQQPLNPKKYENHDGSLNLNQLYAAYGDGYTIVVNEIDWFWKPIKALCHNIRHLLNHQTKGNLYLTPKNQTALSPHYDTHDVFVIQVEGEKHWRIYDEPYKSPLVNSYQPIFQREHLANMREVTMRAGDMMYIPRGVPHDAYTTDSSSLHLTIGVYPTQWLDLMTGILKNVAQKDVSLRKALPAGYFSSPKTMSLLVDKLNEITKKMESEWTSDINVIGGLQGLTEEFRNDEQPMADGHFKSLDQMDKIDLNTRLMKRENLICAVQKAGPHVRIIFPGNVVKGPVGITPSLQFIATNRGGFQVNEIPGISDANKLKLCKRLIRGGLLQIQS